MERRTVFVPQVVVALPRGSMHHEGRHWRR
jgi:hypothetical protein